MLQGNLTCSSIAEVERLGWVGFRGYLGKQGVL